MGEGWLDVLVALLSLGASVARAVATGDTAKVEAVLGGELQTSLVKAAKELEAAEKFGDR